MSLASDTPRENLTLTDADLAACRPVVAEGGHVLRALCPFHGSDRQRSLRVQVSSGRFVCFACGAWGYLEASRAQWREEQQRQSRAGCGHVPGAAEPTPSCCARASGMPRCCRYAARCWARSGRRYGALSLRSLRAGRGVLRTPAFTGLTEHVWTLCKVLFYRVPPWPQPAGL
jgi:hypothetical protein